MLSILLPALILVSDAQAEEPCGPEITPAAEIVADLGGATTANKSKNIPEHNEADTLKLLESVDVHQMDYSAEFDCDDFAMAFDAVCKRKGIPSWEAEIWARDSIFSSWTGHVVNIVGVSLGEGSPNVKYILIEPQNNGQVTSWEQKKGTTPKIPSSAVADMGKYYDWFDKYWQSTTVFANGHAENAGERPFYQIPRIRRLFNQKTGHDWKDVQAESK